MLLPAKSVFRSWLGTVLDFLGAGELELLKSRTVIMVSPKCVVVPPLSQYVRYLSGNQGVIKTVKFIYATTNAFDFSCISNSADFDGFRETQIARIFVKM
jgi:hypothetical protein